MPGEQGAGRIDHRLRRAAELRLPRLPGLPGLSGLGVRRERPPAGPRVAHEAAVQLAP